MAEAERKPTRDAEGSILKRVEERRTTGAKVRKETVYYARVRMNEYDEHGNFVRPHERKRRADSYNDAVILRRGLRLELQADIAKARAKAQLPREFFFDLLDFYEKHYVKEAVFSGNKKIAGQRTPLYQTRQQIRTFREFFGNIPVKEITYSRIFDFKLTLQAQQYKVVRKVYTGKLTGPHKKREFVKVEEWRDRKPATVHRYLSRLRRILYVGLQHGFGDVKTFLQGDPLIETSIEETRVRTCSFEEEEKLQSVCVPPYREHLLWVITIAIETFAREKEFFSMLGSDVDLDNRVITIRETNAKILKQRTVPLSDRAVEAFLAVRGDRSDDEWLTSRVFGVKSVKRSWYTALRLTGIEDLHFHDLRATGITRMLDAGVPVPVVMKFSGHTKYETFMKYVRRDLRMMHNAGQAMTDLYERMRREAKGQLPLGKGPEESKTDSVEVTEAGDAVN